MSEESLLPGMSTALTGTTAIPKLFDHYMKESSGDPLKFNNQEKAILLVELVGGTAGIYYWPTAIAYARKMAAGIKYSFGLGNSVAGVLFLVNATDGFLRGIFLESGAPDAVASFVELPSTVELVKKYLKIGLGSGLCSTPFAVATYLYPLKGCDEGACRILATIHSEVANTALHAIPWWLVLNPENWMYRLPLLPFEKLYSKLSDKCLTPAQRDKISAEAQKEAIYKHYRQDLSAKLLGAVDKIVSHQIKREVKERHSLQYQSLEELVSHADSLDSSPAKNESDPILTDLPPKKTCGAVVWRCIDGIHHGMKQGGSSVLGAVVMTLGTIGWSANPFYLTSKILKLEKVEAFFAGVLPAYSMGVLSSFYGASTLSRTYNWLTHWKGPIKDKFPVIAQLYPRMFATFMLINAYLSLFSYATAKELIMTIFGDEMWDAYRPHLERIAVPAMVSLSFVALMDVYVLWASKAVARWGSDENKQIIRLQLKAQMLSERIMQLKGPELMESIARMSDEQRKALKVTDSFHEDLAKLEQIDSAPKIDFSEQSRLINSSSVQSDLAPVSRRSGFFSCCPRLIPSSDPSVEAGASEVLYQNVA